MGETLSEAMTQQPYRNLATMREKAAILKNDRRMNTMHGRAQIELEQLMTGRFARRAEVSGVEAAPVAFPAAEWTCADPGLEPPTGIDINAQEPTGEPFEINASIERRAASLPSTMTERDDSAGVVATSSNNAERPTGDAAKQDAAGASPVPTKPTVYRRPV